MSTVRPTCVSSGDLRILMLRRPPPFQLPVPSSPRLSYPLASNSYFRRRRRRFQRPLPTSLLSLMPNTPHNFSYKRLTNTTAHSLPDDAAFDLAPNDIDPGVQVKKMAIEILPELKGTSIFLVGINSAMKTGLGKLLADALRYYYFDSDNLVEEAADGDSSGRSFRERDEEGFRESETEVLKQLSSMGRLIVCAGNGAVQTATNLALLRYGLSIWIDVPPGMVVRDIIGNGSQLSESEISTSGSYSEVFSQGTELYEEMRGGFATADATVSVNKLAAQLGYYDLGAVTKEDMALEVLKEIEKLIRRKKMKEAAGRPF